MVLTLMTIANKQFNRIIFLVFFHSLCLFTVVTIILELYFKLRHAA